MNSIPTWWLVLTGLFCGVSLLLTAILIYVVIKLLPALQSISAKVDSIATKVDGIAATSHETIKSLGQRTTALSANAEAFSSVAKGQLEKHLPILTLIFTALKILGAVRTFAGSGKSSKNKRK